MLFTEGSLELREAQICRNLIARRGGRRLGVSPKASGPERQISFPT
jgi:hypothetical protein